MSFPRFAVACGEEGSDPEVMVDGARHRIDEFASSGHFERQDDDLADVAGLDIGISRIQPTSLDQISLHPTQLLIEPGRDQPLVEARNQLRHLPNLENCPTPRQDMVQGRSRPARRAISITRSASPGSGSSCG